MAVRHECKCGHGKGDHSQGMCEYKSIYTFCTVPGCPCRHYVFEKYVKAVKYRTQFTKEKLRAKKNMLKMDDLDSDGRPRYT